MSNLQVIARRCPIMGKALAVQTARANLPGMFRTPRAYSGKAKLHTGRVEKARAVDVNVFGHKEGESGIVRKPACGVAWPMVDVGIADHD
jgi:5-aminolevulinate synthase